MCVGTVIGLVLSVAINICVGIWGVAMLVVGSLILTSPSSIFKNLAYLNLDSYVPEKLKDLPTAMPDDLTELVDAQIAFSSHAAVLISIGLIIIALAVFGFCCGQCGNICRFLYVAGLGTVIVMVSILLICLTTNLGTNVLKTNLEKGLDKTYEKYLKTPESVKGDGTIEVPSTANNYTSKWFAYQSMVQCCGVKGNFEEFKGETPLPPSCCQLIEQRTTPTDKKEYSNYETCIKKNQQYSNKLGCIHSVLATFMIGSQLIQIFLIVGLLLLIGSLACAAFLLGD